MKCIRAMGGRGVLCLLFWMGAGTALWADGFLAEKGSASLAGQAEASWAGSAASPAVSGSEPRSAPYLRPPGPRNSPARGSREGAVALEGPRPSAPALAADFPALSDDGLRIPPDTMGAVGPNHLMVALNSQVKIQTKSGGTVGSVVTLNQFWSPVWSPTGGSIVFDPRVRYDAASGRWIFAATADLRLPSSSLLVGVSQTADPSGAWHLYKYDADAANVKSADFPSLGFNKDWIVVTVNMFGFSGGIESFEGCDTFVFDKGALYAGNGTVFTHFTDATGVNQGASRAAAVMNDPSIGELTLAEALYTSFNTVRLSRVTGTAASPALTLNYRSLTRPETYAYFPPEENFFPQLGTTAKIHAADARLQDAYYRDGELWVVHHVFIPASSPNRAALQWWKIDPSDGSLLDRGRLDSGGANLSYGFPSLAVNKHGDVLIGHSRFSATAYASAYYTFRAGGDPAGTLQTESLLKAGEDIYNKDFGTGRTRWGDYSGTSVDPADDITFWTIQEYAETRIGGVSNWGTWWGKVTPPAGAPTLGPVTVLGTSSVTVRWTDVYNETGYRVLSATAPGINLSGDLAAGTVAHTLTGLGAGETFRFRVQAFNEAATGDSADSSDVCTLAAVPGAPVISSASYESIQVAWTPNGNADGVLYYLERSTDAATFATAASTTGLSAWDTGLLQLSSYTYRLRAENCAGAITDPSVAVSTRTSEGPPYAATGLAAPAISSASITWTWTDNAFNETGYRLFRSSDGSEVTSGLLPPGTESFLQSSLVPNAPHQVYVQGENAFGTRRSADSPLVHTGAAVPVLTSTSASLGSLSLAWSAAGNPAGTVYRAEWSLDGISGTEFYRGTALAATGRNVPAGSVFGSVRAENMDGLLSAYGAPLAAEVPSQLNVVVPTTGLTLVLPVFPADAEVIVPAGTYPGGSVLTIVLPASASYPPPSSNAGAMRLTGAGLQLSGLADPGGALTLSLGYTDTEAAGDAEARLALAWYDLGAGVWIPLPSVRDAAGNRVTARPNRLGLLALVEMSPAGGVGAARTFPNPARPARGETIMTFSNLPAGARIELFASTGRRVRALRADAAGLAFWDLAGDDGAPVSSGVYLLSLDGGEVLRKVAVQR